MTAARKSAAQPSVDPVAVFIARAEAKALLVAIGEIDLHSAVDALQAAAVASGLVDQLGQDEVQRVMSEAFKQVRS